MTDVKDAVKVKDVPAIRPVPMTVYIIMTSFPKSADWDNPGFCFGSLERADEYIEKHRDMFGRDVEIHRLTCGADR